MTRCLGDQGWMQAADTRRMHLCNALGSLEYHTGNKAVVAVAFGIERVQVVEVHMGRHQNNGKVPEYHCDQCMLNLLQIRGTVNRGDKAWMAWTWRW